MGPVGDFDPQPAITAASAMAAMMRAVRIRSARMTHANPSAFELLSAHPMPNCLNCGAALQGPFCSQCGQRVIPPYPSLREMAADAWHEFSGWDGRFLRTFRTLLHPGALTIDVLEGRRARYVSPLRLYLVASVLYFLVAAAIPRVRQPPPVQVPGASRTIDLTQPISAEDRAMVRERLQRAPWWARELMLPMLEDRERQIAGFKATLPRALFLLVPVYAAILGLFYWRRSYTQHLVFALHLQAAMFMALAVAQLANATRSMAIVRTVGPVALGALASYALIAFRRVYRDSWPRIIVKSAGVMVLDLAALMVAMLATYVWAVLT